MDPGYGATRTGAKKTPGENPNNNVDDCFSPSEEDQIKLKALSHLCQSHMCPNLKLKKVVDFLGLPREDVARMIGRSPSRFRINSQNLHTPIYACRRKIKEGKVKKKVQQGAIWEVCELVLRNLSSPLNLSLLLQEDLTMPLTLADSQESSGNAGTRVGDEWLIYAVHAFINPRDKLGVKDFERVFTLCNEFPPDVSMMLRVFQILTSASTFLRKAYTSKLSDEEIQKIGCESFDSLMPCDQITKYAICTKLLRPSAIKAHCRRHKLKIPELVNSRLRGNVALYELLHPPLAKKNITPKDCWDKLTKRWCYWKKYQYSDI